LRFTRETERNGLGERVVLQPEREEPSQGRQLFRNRASEVIVGEVEAEEALEAVWLGGRNKRAGKKKKKKDGL
jgi:hypothetical protein